MKLIVIITMLSTSAWAQSVQELQQACFSGDVDACSKLDERKSEGESKVEVTVQSGEAAMDDDLRKRVEERRNQPKYLLRRECNAGEQEACEKLKQMYSKNNNQDRDNRKRKLRGNRVERDDDQHYDKCMGYAGPLTQALVSYRSNKQNSGRKIQYYEIRNKFINEGCNKYMSQFDDNSAKAILDDRF